MTKQESCAGRKFRALQSQLQNKNNPKVQGVAKAMNSLAPAGQTHVFGKATSGLNKNPLHIHSLILPLQSNQIKIAKGDTN